MDGQKHIINREILELNVPDREHALPYQNKASELIKNKLNPALDQLFSTISKPDEVVSIDRLVVEVGPLSPDKLDEDFVRLAVTNAEEELRRILYNARKTGDIRDSAKSDDETEHVTIKSLKANYLDQFIHFLKTGNLSWWNSTDAENRLVRIVDEVQTYSKNIVQKQVVPLLQKESIRKRLVYQFNDEQLLSFVSMLGSKELLRQQNFIKNTKIEFAKKKIALLGLTEVFWTLLFQWIAANKPLSTDLQKFSFLNKILADTLLDQPKNRQTSIVTTLLEQLLKTQKENQTAETSILLATVLAFVKTTGIESDKVIAILKEIENEKYPLVLKYLKEFAEKTDRVVPFENESVIKSAEEPHPEEKPEKRVTLEKSDSDQQFTAKRMLETEEILVSNAGLVILHPFLRYFFEGLGLLDKDLQFKNAKAQIKAVHLLQYIAKKTNIHPEFELSLNKILCGIDVWEPIPTEVKISKAEKDESENLLKTVLERWHVLRTKNTEALRETFLNREGKLTFENRGWNLKIERNSFDVLLDKLPWGISIIKLPWTEQIIHVEW